MADAPFLTIEIHDSDLATVSYEPGPASGGLAYLGFQPRDYFEDPGASEDVDLNVQEAGLAAWAHGATGSSVEAKSIRPLLAEDEVEDPEDDFVEETAIRFIELLGLPPLPVQEVEA